MRKLLAPGFVFVLGLVATLAATLSTYRFVTAAERARFERLVAVTRSTLDHRLGADVDAVHAAAGLFATRGELTQTAFERFISHLSPTWRLRTRSVGWVEKRGDAFVIRYVHPSSPEGLDHVGRDLGENRIIRSAMTRAAAIGEVTSSELVPLGADETRRGFFMFFPVYRVGASLETASDRRQALRGFVFTTENVDSLTKGIQMSPAVETVVGAEPVAAGKEQEAHMSVELPFGPLGFDATRSLRIGDQEWAVRFRSTDAFWEGSSWSLIYLTGLVTLMITLLFTAVTWSESRARAEAEATNRRLAESEEALKRANRAKDEFLGVVSHELRNPLGAMAGAINILRLRASLDDPAARRALEIADRQVKHQSRLVDDLLDVTRLATSNILLEVKPVDLNRVVERAVADARSAAAERDHRIDFTPWHQPLIVDGDAVRLGQIALNLITNSIKYTPDGGHIDVEVRPSGSRATLVVRDDGAGIPPDIVDHIFSPFYQERLGLGASKGMGLGLTIVQRLVALHGGAVGVHSAGRDQGAEFTVDLPLSKAREATPARAQPAPASPPVPQRTSRPVHAVIIDDLDDGREVLRVLLESMGVRVDDAGTGQGGIDLIERHRPDIALVDIDLPDITGLEVAQRVRKSGRDDLLLVAVTGYGAKDDEVRAREAGFDEYLVKPVDARALGELIQDLARRLSLTSNAREA